MIELWAVIAIELTVMLFVILAFWLCFYFFIAPYCDLYGCSCPCWRHGVSPAPAMWRV